MKSAQQASGTSVPLARHSAGSEVCTLSLRHANFRQSAIRNRGGTSNAGLGSVTKKPKSWIPDTGKKKIVLQRNMKPDAATFENVA